MLENMGEKKNRNKLSNLNNDLKIVTILKLFLQTLTNKNIFYIKIILNFYKFLCNEF